MEEFKPGNVITPRTAASQSDPVPPTSPAGTPQPEQPIDPAPEAPVPARDSEAVAQPVEAWQFRQEDEQSPFAEFTQNASLPDQVSWTAQEFVFHDKSAGWYGILALGGIVGVVLVYLLTKDKITTGIIAFAILMVGVFAAQKPKQQTYTIDAVGLHVGTRTYDLQSFKHFSISEESNHATIVLMPLKRFMPPLTIYLDAGNEEQVVDYLAQVLPFEQHKQDAVDSLIKRIRF